MVVMSDILSVDDGVEPQFGIVDGDDESER